MTRSILLRPLAVAAFLVAVTVAAGAGSGARAGAPEVRSLRGGVDVEATTAAPRAKPMKEEGRVPRNYRQQPPLIPHAIEGYEINLKDNACLMCHDWPANATTGAPKVSETHYVGRDGVSHEQVSRSRWFCTQCHVPQVNAPALVGNTFKPAGKGR